MKKPKKRTLYSNMNADFERVKQWMEENSDRIPTDEEVWDEIYELDKMDWEDFTYMFEDFFNNGTFVLQGTIGCWYGTCYGGYVFDTFSGLCRCFDSYDYVEIYDMNGHLYVDCSHHDGSNHYEVRILTERGREYANRHEYDMEERELHTRLMQKSYYSVLPHVAHKVWGHKKVEYVK